MRSWDAEVSGARRRRDEQPRRATGPRPVADGGESWPTRAPRISARGSASPEATAHRWPTSCASATTAARASARWRRRPTGPTASCTGSCRSPARASAAAEEPTGTARRGERAGELAAGHSSVANASGERQRGGGVSGPDHDGWVRTARDGAVLTVTLDRPDRLNAQTPATWEALAAVGSSLDDGVRVVVVRGAGVWSTGAQDRSWLSANPGTPGGVGELGRPPAGEAQEPIRRYQAGFRWLRSPGVVSIAAVQGHAIGAGAQLALACDLRVLTEDADLRLPEATLGLVPDLTGTSTLVELVGYSRALELCLTGRSVGAAEARAIGLANAVVPAAGLEEAVGALVTAIAAAPVGASRETTALVRSAVRSEEHTSELQS